MQNNAQVIGHLENKTNDRGKMPLYVAKLIKSMNFVLNISFQYKLLE